ncbi:MAG: hypothetical protein LEGION0403_FIIPPAGN_02114 [Legionella sp.]
MGIHVMKEEKPTNAIHRPLGSSFEVNDAILSSMSRSARLSKGAMNYSDTLEQGAQINNELVILQQFNLVVFLKIMQEFQEISRIYNPDERFSHKLSMLLEMERELEAKHKQTQFLYAEQERQRISKNQEQVNQQSHDQDAKHRQLMNELEMLQQLQHELQHLRETHYARQNVLYDELSTMREEQMDEMLKVARKSDDISPKQLARLEEIQEKHQRCKEQIDKMPTTDAHGKFDWDRAKLKEEAQKKLNEETNRELTDWAYDNRHVNGVQPCFQKHQVKIEGQEKIIAKNERGFKTQEARLQEQIEIKHNATKVAQQISESVALIEQMDKSKLSSQERATIESLSTELEKCKHDLASSQSLKTQQNILTSCVSNLKEIDAIIKPGTANSEPYKAFQNSINDLEKKLSVHSNRAPNLTMDKVRTQTSLSEHGVNNISTPPDISAPHGFSHYKSTYKEMRSEGRVNNESLTQLKQIINEEFQPVVGYAGIEDEDAEMIQALQDNLAKVLSCNDISKLDSELLQDIINPISNLGEKYTLIEDSLKKISSLCTKIEQPHQPQINDENTNTNQCRI